MRILCVCVVSAGFVHANMHVNLVFAHILTMFKDKVQGRVPPTAIARRRIFQSDLSFHHRIWCWPTPAGDGRLMGIGAGGIRERAGSSRDVLRNSALNRSPGAVRKQPSDGIDLDWCVKPDLRVLLSRSACTEIWRSVADVSHNNVTS